MDPFQIFSKEKDLYKYMSSSIRETHWVDEYLKSGDPNDAVRKAYPNAKGNKVYSISKRNQKKFGLNGDVLLGRIIDNLRQGRIDEPQFHGGHLSM
ncbi:MAG: hypothetical protein WC846_02425 [Candidatus Gracilibacteria bacterium]